MTGVLIFFWISLFLSISYLLLVIFEKKKGKRFLDEFRSEMDSSLDDLYFNISNIYRNHIKSLDKFERKIISVPLAFKKDVDRFISGRKDYSNDNKGKVRDFLTGVGEDLDDDKN